MFGGAGLWLLDAYGENDQIRRSEGFSIGAQAGNLLKKLRLSKKWVIPPLLILLALTGLAGWLGLQLYRFAHTSAGSTEKIVVFDITPGERLQQVAEHLHSTGIVTSASWFKVLAQIRKSDKQIKVGEYELSAGMTPMELLDTLVSGRVMRYILTIPEGYNASQIAAAVESAGLGNANEFRTLALQPDSAAALAIDAPSLEGYLFPDTYYFTKGESPLKMMGVMVQRFREQLPSGWQERATALDMSLHQIITLASIIEKETADPAERPLISSVFHNRLKKKMRLDSDPTVIYGIIDFDGNLTRRHLTTPTPYNTYVIKGLPPSPIANPGRAAIEAALNPAQSDYLFFVARQDRRHQFSSNLRDHNRAVQEHQVRPYRRQR